MRLLYINKIFIKILSSKLLYAPFKNPVSPDSVKDYNTQQYFVFKVIYIKKIEF